VLPQWLIEMTGNPKRTATFGYQHLKNGELAPRRFSFDSFKFSACESCNLSFSSLESEASVIIHKVLSDDSLSNSELNTLLDWFDKLRIGLWLAHQYLNKNPMGINPHFHIATRIGQSDRMLAIFKANGDRHGLNTVGEDTPLFTMTPSCFCLRINSYFFLNMSCHNLIARRLGFPFSKIDYFTGEGDELRSVFIEGRNRIMLPILKKRIGLQGTELYQPTFSGIKIKSDPTLITELYDTKYVRDRCIIWEKGIGKIFLQNNNVDELAVYPDSPSKIWVPKRIYDFDDLTLAIQNMAFEWQLYIEKLRPSFELISVQKRSDYIRLHNDGEKYNREIMELLSEQKRHQKPRRLWT